MKHYEHTETGWVIIGAMSAGMAIFSPLALLPRGIPSALLYAVPAVMLAGMLAMFRMCTYADEGGAGFAMGVGVVRRYFSYGEIEAVSELKMGFLAGWGIHYAGGGWLFNVNSLKAVELRLKDGRRCFIGTDDPQGFIAAVQPRLRG